MTSAPPSSIAAAGRTAEAGAPGVLLEVDGMRCAGCVRAVEQHLLAQPGVRQASVNLLAGSAWVATEPGLDPTPLPESLTGLGFEARLRDGTLRLPPGPEDDRRLGSWWRQWRQLLVAVLLLLASGGGHLAHTGLLPRGPWVEGLASLGFHSLVASLALLGPGRTILVGGARALLAGRPGMDSLVGLGLVAAYLASLVALLLPGLGWPCFFDEPVMLLAFVLLGRFLEERVRRRAGSALEQLLALQPAEALLRLGDDPPRPVAVAALRPGDRLQLLPGDRLAVDARVLAGESSLDRSSLTGELLPVEAGPGTELAAGCLNLTAPLELEACRSGADSAINRIITLVEQAQARKAPIQGLADRVAGRFTWGVLALALATFLFWWLWGTALWPQVLDPQLVGMGSSLPATPFGLALQLAIAVLVVACPCALGLATPTAIAVGCGQAARTGLLFRGGAAIERAAALRTVLFDKTGTLTLGRPLVRRVQPLPPPATAQERQRRCDELLQKAASLEQHSRHPLAHALLQEAARRGLPPLPLERWSSTGGCGLEGELRDGGGVTLRVGRLGWLLPLLDPGAEEAGRLREAEEQLAEGSESTLAVAEGERCLGLVAVEDALRGDAGSTLAGLRRLGLGLGVLSGDRRGAVQQLGERLGFQPAELAWELLPEQKLLALEAARRDGPVAMVGDGINDAPALAAADLGIAIAGGTQIAQDSAELVVLTERLAGVLEALLLARRTMAKVRQNLAWAFGYNLIMLPIAAGALLPALGWQLSPPLAALLMALSSITVVVNALLLQRP